MAQDDSGGRRYTEEEFALVLRKAAELRTPPSSTPSGPESEGLSLEEMRSIAAEAGIDPEAVTRATALLDAADWGEPRGFSSLILGGPSAYHLEFEASRHLRPEDLNGVLAVIRRSWERQGTTSEVLGGLQWQTEGELSAVTVNVFPRGDGTVIQIVGDRRGAGAVTFVFPIAASAILLGALGAAFEPTSVAGILSLVTGTLGAGFVTARTIWTVSTRRFKRRLTRLMDTVSTAVERIGSPSAEA